MKKMSKENAAIEEFFDRNTDFMHFVGKNFFNITVDYKLLINCF